MSELARESRTVTTPFWVRTPFTTLTPCSCAVNSSSRPWKRTGSTIADEVTGNLTLQPGMRRRPTGCRIPSGKVSA